MQVARFVLLCWSILFSVGAQAETAFRVVDIPSRPGVTQRFLYATPPHAKAAVILFAGGHGGLSIKEDGSLGWGGGNFLVRSRDLFVAQGLAVAVIDKPSDRVDLAVTRQTPEHVADVQAVMAWLREETRLPVWLIGTSRGTQSAAYVAVALAGDPSAPDGLVLTSSILSDYNSRPVPAMALEQVRRPVLVVHHDADACKKTLYGDVSLLMNKLGNVSRKELITVHGGENQGDPCEARAYHGFNGLEKDVVAKIAAWMLAP